MRRLQVEITFLNEADFFEGCSNLGFCLMTGYGCRKDADQARYYLKKAREMKNPTACKLLGELSWEDRASFKMFYREACVLKCRNMLKNQDLGIGEVGFWYNVYSENNHHLRGGF